MTRRERERREATLRRLRDPYASALRVEWAHAVPNDTDLDAVITCSNCGGHCTGPKILRLRVVDVAMSRGYWYEKRGQLFQRSGSRPTSVYRNGAMIPRSMREVAGWEGPSGRIVRRMNKRCWSCGARIDWRAFVRRRCEIVRMARRDERTRVGAYSAASEITPE